MSSVFLSHFSTIYVFETGSLTECEAHQLAIHAKLANKPKRFPAITSPGLGLQPSPSWPSFYAGAEDLTPVLKLHGKPFINQAISQASLFLLFSYPSLIIVFQKVPGGKVIHSNSMLLLSVLIFNSVTTNLNSFNFFQRAKNLSIDFQRQPSKQHQNSSYYAVQSDIKQALGIQHRKNQHLGCWSLAEIVREFKQYETLSFEELRPTSANTAGW